MCRPHDFNWLATGIGSLPLTDPEQAAALALEYCPEAPLWPQLPQRDFREHMDVQYSEALPGCVVDQANRRVFFDSSKDLTPELEMFYERYLAKDYGFFRLTECYAPGFYALRRALQKGLPPRARFLKGHITGPLTAGLAFKDETGRDIVHHPVLYDAVVKGLAMKAAWQIQELQPFGRPVIIFIDEPAIESLGSAFCAVSSVTVAEKLNEIIDAIHDLGGIAGLHCCGNADWPMLFGTRVDMVNFDAFGYLERVLLYPADIRKFLGRGGALAWGIVPTGPSTGSESADALVARLEGGLQRMERAGVERSSLARQSLITPSCGMGNLTPEAAVAILQLARDVADRMQSRRP
ncbi:MAG: methionine synthase [Kiritimatiellaeota bacterium]|nr:methionine synthase [Kiritimatiellota bacterium]